MLAASAAVVSRYQCVSVAQDRVLVLVFGIQHTGCDEAGARLASLR